MPKIKEYRVLSFSKAKDLESEVAYLILKGFIPLGGVSGGGRYTEYIQAMVKYDAEIQ